MGEAVEDRGLMMVTINILVPSFMEGQVSYITTSRKLVKIGLERFPTYDRQGFIKLMSETLLILGIADMIADDVY